MIFISKVQSDGLVAAEAQRRVPSTNGWERPSFQDTAFGGTMLYSPVPQRLYGHHHYSWISANTFFITAKVLPGSSALVISHCI